MSQALLAVLAVVLAGGPADPADRLRAAVARAAAGEPEAAAADLIALADDHREQPVAAEALAKAAQIREERLADPIGAALLWERLLREHPDHRAARRATARLAELRSRVGPEGQAAAAYAQFRALVAERRFTEARAVHRELVARGDDLHARAAGETLDRIDAAERIAARAVWGWLALALVTALLTWSLRRGAGSWPGAARALTRIPTEVIYLVPASALVIIVAHTGNLMVARAVLWIGIGGVIVTWLSGSALDAERSRSGRVTPIRAIAHAIATAAAIAALAYIAVSRDQLLALLAETVRFGHEGSP